MITAPGLTPQAFHLHLALQPFLNEMAISNFLLAWPTTKFEM